MPQTESDAFVQGIKKDIQELKAAIEELRDLQIEDDKKLALSEKDIQTLQTNMNSLVYELRETRTELQKDVHELKLLIAEDYVEREGFLQFADKVVGTLDKLNEKIDASHKELYTCIVTGDEEVKNSVGSAFWKVVGACIALGGVLVSAIKALVDFVKSV